MTLNFSGRHYPKEIILQSLRYYLAYKLSYREIEEIFAERNIHFDHSTLNRWVIKYSPPLEANFRTRKRKVTDSWLMNETYIKIKGKWIYYYRAVDKHGAIVDFYLSETRDEPAARAFIVEQSHRKVKGKMHQCLGWKSWARAEATLAGVELCSMLKQGQMIDSEYKAVWEQFYSLAA
ncbi:IS6 family transposase [Colwellia sp. MB02u-9]|uniref:IS6 family transposase n=1 Tax=Colwellia sp. MB02u-9 TaxID=2759823 RepID=UPI0015F4556D|nr:IS6 family transposase [Colwellia sp. MB02u-9]MBA6296587.1 IS6 family transposase [Colwellia sp. MB02u-9]